MSHKGPMSGTKPLPGDSSPLIEADIAVVGAGAAGLISALALAQQGRKIALIGREPPPLPGRTVALFEGSLSILEDFDLRDCLSPISEPILGMRIIDATPSFFRPAPAYFAPQEIGLEAFGVNIPNDDIVKVLAQKAAQTPQLIWCQSNVAAYDFTSDPDAAILDLDDGRKIKCPLVIAGDGRNSLARRSAKIGVKEWSYEQTALTAILHHRRPHHGVTTEWHTRSGPFTFVPMPPLAEAPHRSSLVWLMSPLEAKRRSTMPPEDLAREIAGHAHYRYGPIGIEGALGAFPMAGMRTHAVTAPRLMLVGEACHVFPPLSAQGLNLGIRDAADAVATLEDVDLTDARAIETALAIFERSRRADIDLRTHTIDILNRSLLWSIPPVDFLRGAAMTAVSSIGPLRRAVLKEGVQPSLAQTYGAWVRHGGGASAYRL